MSEVMERRTENGGGTGGGGENNHDAGAFSLPLISKVGDNCTSGHLSCSFSKVLLL